jgi:hypothetical protein
MNDTVKDLGRKPMVEYTDDPTAKMMREFNRQSRTIRDLIDGPTAKITRDLDRQSRTIRDLIDGPTAKITRDLDRQSRVIRDLIDGPTAKITRDLDRRSRTIRDLIDGPTAKMILNLTEQSSAIRDLTEGTTAKIVRGLAENYLHSRELVNSAPAFAEHRFPAEMEALNAEFAVLANTLSDEDAQVSAVGEIVSRIFDQLLLLLQRTSSALEVRAVREIILFLIPLVFAWYLAYASDRHVDNLGGEIRQETKDQARQQREKLADEHMLSATRDATIERKLDEVIALMEEKSSAMSERSFYVVKRAVPLCESRTICRGKIALLNVHTVVEIIERARKWVFVEAITESGDTKRGWVLKKYLRRGD